MRAAEMMQGGMASSNEGCWQFEGLEEGGSRVWRLSAVYDEAAAVSGRRGEPITGPAEVQSASACGS